VPDKSGNYGMMKVKILSTKYEMLNNTKAQVIKFQSKRLLKRLELNEKSKLNNLETLRRLKNGFIFV
jgi:hypothetical protein